MHSGKYFFFFFVLVLFTSCNQTQIIEESLIKPDLVDEVWSDSVFNNLSEKQKYNQHLIIKISSNYIHQKDSLVNWIIAEQPGGLFFENWDFDSIQSLKIALDSSAVLQPFYFVNYFDVVRAQPYPFWLTSENLREEKYTSFFSKTGNVLLNYSIPVVGDEVVKNWLDTLYNKQKIFPIVGSFDDKEIKSAYSSFLNLISQNDYPVKLKLHHFDTVNLNAIKQQHSYEGLFIVESKESRINLCMQNGADLIFKNIESGDKFSEFNLETDQNERYVASTKKIIEQKSFLIQKSQSVNSTSEINHIKLNYQLHNVSLLSNQNKLLPFKSKFSVYSPEKMNLIQKIKTEHNVSLFEKEISGKSINEIANQKGNKVIILPDTLNQEIIESLNALNANQNTLIVFSNESHFAKISEVPHLIFKPKMHEFDYAIFVQQLDGSLPVIGNFYADSIITGNRIDKIKLARTKPELCGMDADTLKQIGWLVENTISRKGTPGAQVLIAKDGCIIYDRVFGKHTYAGNSMVTENSMYDLASITKVVSTTLMSMKLYEMGMYELNDSLGQYLPDSLRQHLRFPSTIRNITFQEILTHTSGLPAGFPIIKYMQYTNANVGRFDRFFCDRKDSCYAIEVAENFYLEIEQQDSMWLRMNQIYLDPSKPYKYSDVNMNLMYFMLKSFIDKQPEKFGFTQSKKQLKDKNLYVEYLYKTFYEPLGMNHTTYLPIKKFNRDIIVPTENETYWRKQLLHGYVHDPNAALHGGIAGNAGIFSTTNDLVKLFQMWLNKGIYNGQRFLKAETVDKFTARQENCFRGLGFNKPSMGTTSFGMSENASMSTYGHTGFTGTCFWIDPEYNLIYIYLSNAVHPQVSNKENELGIRKKLHQCAYDAMMLKDF